MEGFLHKGVDNSVFLFYIRCNDTDPGNDMNSLRLLPLSVLLMVSSLVPLSSCKGPSTKSLTPPEVKGERSPERIKELINERSRSIRTVEAQLTIISKKEPYAGRYKALLFFKRPDQLRVKTFQAFGPTLSDLLMKGNVIEAYIPNKNTVFKADLPEETKKPGTGLTPLGLIKGILQVGIDESEELSLSQDPGGAIVLDHLKKGRLVKKTEIDTRSLLIKKETLFGAGEQSYLITSYAEYRKANGQWWPFRIEFREPTKDPFMSFEFQSVRTNIPMRRDIFKLDVPPGVKTVHQ
jgi:outer membrane lipoprotein-sorting protein